MLLKRSWLVWGPPSTACLLPAPLTCLAQVDLHGMSVLEARAAVLCVLSMLQQQFRDTGGVTHDVTIITGRGAGSEGGEPVVRREVAALLQRLHLHLPPEAPPDNPGRIVIPRQVSSGTAAQGAARLPDAQRAGLEAGSRCWSSAVALLPLPHIPA